MSSVVSAKSAMPIRLFAGIVAVYVSCVVDEEEMGKKKYVVLYNEASTQPQRVHNVFVYCGYRCRRQSRSTLYSLWPIHSSLKKFAFLICVFVLSQSSCTMVQPNTACGHM